MENRCIAGLKRRIILALLNLPEGILDAFLQLFLCVGDLQFNDCCPPLFRHVVAQDKIRAAFTRFSFRVQGKVAQQKNADQENMVPTLGT